MQPSAKRSRRNQRPKGGEGAGVGFYGCSGAPGEQVPRWGSRPGIPLPGVLPRVGAATCFWEVGTALATPAQHPPANSFLQTPLGTRRPLATPHGRVSYVTQVTQAGWRVRVVDGGSPRGWRDEEKKEKINLQSFRHSQASPLLYVFPELLFFHI